jgi:hypothetical protein
MALAPRDVPVTRDNVDQWLKAWQRASNLVTFNKDWPTYLREKIDALNLPDKMVITTSLEGFGDETPLVDMILLDMASYGYKI